MFILAVKLNNPKSKHFYFPYAITQKSGILIHWRTVHPGHIETNLLVDPYAVASKLQRFGNALRANKIGIERLDLGPNITDHFDRLDIKLTDEIKLGETWGKVHLLLEEAFCLKVL